MESTFNIDALQNSQFQESNATAYVPIPEGEYKAIVDKFALRQAKTSVICDVTWKIDDASVTEATGIENPTVRQSIFLDVSESGGLEFGAGKNVNLGRLREALGQNQSGQAWQFGMLVGQLAKIKVTQRPVKNDSTGETVIYNDVGAVTKFA